MSTVLRNRLARPLAAAAVLAVLAVLAAPTRAYPADPSPDVLKYLPDDAQFVASVKVAEFLDSAVWQEARKNIPDIEKTAKEFKDATNLDPKDVESVVFAMEKGPDAKDPDFLGFIKTRKAVKVADLVASLKGKAEFKESKIAGHTVYEDAKEQKMAMTGLDDRTILIGSTKTLTAALKRNGPARLSPAMKATLGQADFSQTMTLAVDVKMVAKKTPTDTGVEEKYLEPLVGVVLSAKTGADVTFKLDVVCKDAETAEDGRKFIDGALVVMKYYAREQKDWPKEVPDLIRKVKVSNDGPNLHASLTVPTAVLTKLSKSEAIKPKP